MAEGLYADGLSGRRRPVRLRLDGGVLEIGDPEGAAVAAWPLGEIRALEDEGATGPPRLARGDERLQLGDPAFAATLAAAAPHLAARPSRWTAPRILAAALGSVLLVAGAYHGLRWAAIAGAERMPPAWEARIGAVAHGYMSRKTCEGPAGKGALAILQRRLTDGVELRFPLDLRVVDIDQVNAVALPGGRILLFRGLIEAAESPDEVAGVLAHEIGHVRHRHVMQAFIHAAGLQVLVGLVTGGAGGEWVQQLAALSYSREKEEEADREAMALLRRAGIDPTGLARMFDRLKEREGKGAGMPLLLRTHPHLEERSASIRAAAGTAGEALSPALTPGEWLALRGICGGKSAR
ncbi:MAG TPA: M48 family metallopeptidase [Azospirillaceae bacterium]|nr:M48 family metallopeptidase [Azospirillaceae bacterium]